MNRLLLRAIGLSTLVTFYACGSSDEPELESFSTRDGECIPGDEEPCQCGSGAIQTRTCDEDGWSECDCPVCGNGTIEIGEQCDGTNLAEEDCATYTMNAQPGGELRCGPTCSFDTSGCTGGGAGGTPGSGGVMGAGATLGSGGVFGGGGTLGGGGIGP